MVSQVKELQRGFQAVRIIGVDKNGLHQAEALRGRVYNIPFLLSTEPSLEWVREFHKERDFHKNPARAFARVDGNCIIVSSPINELELHFYQLKKDVEVANQAYKIRLVNNGFLRDRAPDQQEQHTLEQVIAALNFS